MQRKCRRIPIAIAIVFVLVFGLNWLLSARADQRFVGRWQVESNPTAAVLCPWFEVVLSGDGWGTVRESIDHVGRPCRWQVEGDQLSLRVFLSDEVCLPDSVESAMELLTGCTLRSTSLTFAIDRCDVELMTLRPAPKRTGNDRIAYPSFELHRCPGAHDMRIGWTP